MAATETVFDVGKFVQSLIGDGFNISVSNDGEKIKIDTSHSQLSDQQRQTIKDHKEEILIYLRRKAWNPKVAKGATHYILYRSHKQIREAPPEVRAKLIAQVEPKLTAVWQAFEHQDRWELMKALTALNRDIRSFAENVGLRPLPRVSVVTHVSKNVQD